MIRECEECGREFEPGYRDQLFCSDVCATGEPMLDLDVLDAAGAQEPLSMIPDALAVVQAAGVTCAWCGAESRSAGQFLADGRWVCTARCHNKLQSWDDLAATGGIGD